MDPSQPAFSSNNRVLPNEIVFTVFDQLLSSDGSTTHDGLCTIRKFALLSRRRRGLAKGYMGGSGGVYIRRALNGLPLCPDYSTAFASNPSHPPGSCHFDLVSKVIDADCGGCLQILIDCGLNPRAYRDGESLLCRALLHKSVWADLTPLMCAAKDSSERCAVWLLKHGADPNYMSPAGETAAWWAAARISSTGLVILRSLVPEMTDINVGSGILAGTLLFAVIEGVQTHDLINTREDFDTESEYWRDRRKRRAIANEMIDTILAKSPDLLA